MINGQAYFFVPAELEANFVGQLVCLDENLHAQSEPQSVSLDNLADNIENMRLTIIIPGNRTSIHRLKMPLLTDKKARLAIPYALEENLAQPVTELHFAFDRKFYHEGAYTVIACDKAWFQHLTQLLAQQNIEPHTYTISWFALQPDQCLVHQQALLCRSENLNGQLPLALWSVAAEDAHHTPIAFLQFGTIEKLPSAIKKNITVEDVSYCQWVAKHLAQSPMISLNQGAFATKSKENASKLPVWLASGATLLWMLTWLSIQIFAIKNTEQQVEVVDSQIAQIYRQFYPGAKQVISPRFRINQKIKGLNAGGDNAIWHLLSHIAMPVSTAKITIQQLSFQNKRLTLRILADNFSQLESFMKALKNQSLKANQLNATRNQNQIEATVEVSS